MRHGWLVLVLALALAACKGPEGPMGPRGEQGVAGLPGPAGPGTKATYFATIQSSGGASVQLPAAAGSAMTTPPALACYVTSPTSSVWLAVASTPSGTYPFCGLVFDVPTSRFWATMAGATPGWTAAFVIVY